jgi:predicted nucleic acid-binding protein
MVGTNVLFDTNILIDYLSGVVEARAELERYPDRAISVITP